MKDTNAVSIPDPSQADEFLSRPGEGLAEAMGEIEGPVMVLGAGGKMGLHVCVMLRRADRAAGREREVIAVSRFSSVHSREAFECEGVRIIAADLEDEEALARLPDCHNLIFMAGAKFGTSDNPGLLERMNIEVPRKVAKRFPGSRFIVFSSGCVYSMVPPETGGPDEDGEVDPPGEYARSCLGREEAFREACLRDGTQAVLIRLNYSTEFRYGVLVDIGSKVFEGQPISLDMGYLNLIWQRDAVDQILRTFTFADSPATVLNITGDQVYSVRELAEGFARRFGRQPTFTGEEADTAWISNASRSHQLLGKPPTGLETMMDWTAEWIRAGYPTFGKPTGFEKRSGRF